MKGIVFGATGNIGRPLLADLSARGWTVMGTCTQEGHAGLFPFKVQTDDLSCIPTGNESWDYGIIACAISRIDACKQDPIGSRSVNVDGTIRLAKQLIERGICPVFLSSDYVFSGEKGGYVEEDPVDPVTTYGRQKAEVECWLQAHMKHALIVRLSKVLSVDAADQTLLAEWYRAITESRVIRCASDQWLCPTYVGDVVDGLRLLMESRISGIYHVCQPERYDRATLLKLFCNVLGINCPGIELLPSAAFGFSDRRSKDTSMSPVKFQRATGYSFTSMEACCRHFQNNLPV